MISVINYHYIRDDFTQKYPSIFGMTTKQFKRQLLLLKNQGDFININNFRNNYKALLSSKENFFLITFDDGLKEQYLNGYAVLDELDLQGYFFLNALNFKEKKVSLVHQIHLLRSTIHSKEILDFINKHSDVILTSNQKSRSHKVYRFDDKPAAELKFLINYIISDKIRESIIGKLFNKYFYEGDIVNELYMDKNQVLELSNQNMIGNHTYSHKNLGNLETKDAFFEINNSKIFFENFCNNKIEAISYPYGSKEVYSESIINFVKKTDHKFGFTTNKGINSFNDDLLKLNRFDCNDVIGGKNYESKRG